MTPTTDNHPLDLSFLQHLNLPMNSRVKTSCSLYASSLTPLEAQVNKCFYQSFFKEQMTTPPTIPSMESCKWENVLVQFSPDSWHKATRTGPD